jgi:hypothetical protein
MVSASMVQFLLCRYHALNQRAHDATRALVSWFFYRYQSGCTYTIGQDHAYQRAFQGECERKHYRVRHPMFLT